MRGGGALVRGITALSPRGVSDWSKTAAHQSDFRDRGAGEERCLEVARFPARSAAVALVRRDVGPATSHAVAGGGSRFGLSSHDAQRVADWVRFGPLASATVGPKLRTRVGGADARGSGMKLMERGGSWDRGSSQVRESERIPRSWVMEQGGTNESILWPSIPHSSLWAPLVGLRPRHCLCFCTLPTRF